MPDLKLCHSELNSRAKAELPLETGIMNWSAWQLFYFIFWNKWNGVFDAVDSYGLTSSTMKFSTTNKYIKCQLGLKHVVDDIMAFKCIPWAGRHSLIICLLESIWLTGLTTWCRIFILFYFILFLHKWNGRCRKFVEPDLQYRLQSLHYSSKLTPSLLQCFL